MQNQTILQRIEEYRQSDAVSQSLLIALSKGIGFFNLERQVYKKKPYFDMGDLVECLLCYRQEFDNRFFVIDNIPGGVAAQIIRSVNDYLIGQYGHSIGIGIDGVRCHISLDSDGLRDIILSACDQFQYGGDDWSDERKLNGIYKLADYFEKLQECGERTDITSKQLEEANILVTKIISHRFTADIFSLPMEYQVALYTEYRGHKIKSLLDMCVFDEEHKTIMPFDLKTTGDSVREFPKAVRLRRYDVQAAWYSFILSKVFPHYKVLPFKFIVVSTKYDESPLIYTMTETAMEIARWGGYFEYSVECGKQLNPVTCHYQTADGTEEQYRALRPDVLGFEQMLSIYEEHLWESQWEYDMEIFRNNGDLPLNIW